MSVDAIRSGIEGFGKFAELVEIPGGANAYAFRGIHRALREVRFLKCVPLVDAEQDTILNEPQTLIDLLRMNPRNPHLVEMQDAEILVIGGERYVLLQMEYVAGDSLQHQIEARIFGQQEAVRITQGVVRGLQDLHQKRLVHRDLKLGNLMLAGSNAKIADFGSVARIPATATFIRASKMTDFYRANECWSANHYCFQSDLYQVGLILNQLVNGPMSTVGSNYHTRAVKKAMAEADVAYERLDAFAQCEWDRRSFAELTASDKILAKTCEPRPYVARSVNQIIRDLMKADLASRLQTANDVQQRLSRISTPNWKPAGTEFIASSWKGWDWRVRFERSEYVVERSQPGMNRFRRFHATQEAKDAFRFVEDAE